MDRRHSTMRYPIHPLRASFSSTHPTLLPSVNAPIASSASDLFCRQGKR